MAAGIFPGSLRAAFVRHRSETGDRKVRRSLAESTPIALERSLRTGRVAVKRQSSRAKEPPILGRSEYPERTHRHPADRLAKCSFESLRNRRGGHFLGQGPGAGRVAGCSHETAGFSHLQLSRPVLLSV